MATFRIATFVDDEEQYSEMRASFEAAGFIAPLARFTIEPGEPYAGIGRLGGAREPFVLLAHQDVRCDRGDTAGSLEARLAELADADPDWTIAGNAGIAERRVRHISDPHGTHWEAGLPERVVTLDENLLILRTARRPACSTELSGWHLYGADVVFNALLTGGAAYVVDFKLTHLSGGRPQGYRESRRAFLSHWRTRLRDGRAPDAAALGRLGDALTSIDRDEEAVRGSGGR